MRPIVVNAVRINGDFEVDSLEGIVKGKPGDYLMQGVMGELYVCPSDIFDRTYDFLI